MHLILCVDDRDGLSFCGRRLSRDSRVTEHILSTTREHNLWSHPYSANLFPEGAVIADAQFQTKAGQGDYCFLEITPLLSTYENLESVILYHWNRSYPSTVKFDRKILESLHLTHTEEFSGNSHEWITVERYTL